jgi:2-keto-4-pentenoate hydratase/2-oxohepta-3-ene-1,7-dioic acid hydratase in catechol pathway
VTPDEFPECGEWIPLVKDAARNTRLLPGDIIAAGSRRDGPYRAGGVVELAHDEIGVLRNTVVAR